MPSYSFRDPKLSEQELVDRIAPFAHKWAWFMEAGYGRRYDPTLKQKVTHGPHYYQGLFHTLVNPDDDCLCRFRHLVAGRRGGKTLSAAWEVLYYALHPAQFHWDAHRLEDDRPLRVWVLIKDLKVGQAALDAFREAIRAAGLVYREDYEENKSEFRFEFKNGSRVQFRTAVDPESLRGPGLDILWMDETAAIRARDAYDVVSPAIDDMEGIVICTTTPKGKNWYHEEFWSAENLVAPEQGRVEYRSIDNPHFPRKSWEYRKRTYHPLLFKQEFEASFDSMAGIELQGEWLTDNFYGMDDLPVVVEDGRSKVNLTLYMGVDPAISLSDKADYFAMALIGVSKDLNDVYLLETYKSRIPFGEQVDVISQWFHKYRPSLIGIEAQAYQAALAQAVAQLDTMPPVVPMMAKGKKAERILSMGPLFRAGKARVKETHKDFIEEWLDYDSTLKNPKDDMLDAVEIALRTAGALLPIRIEKDIFDHPSADIHDLALRDLKLQGSPNKQNFDEVMGIEW